MLCSIINVGAKHGHSGQRLRFNDNFFFLNFICADKDTSTFSAQQRTTGSYRFSGIVVARSGEDQNRITASFATPGKYRPVLNSPYPFDGFFPQLDTTKTSKCVYNLCW